MVFSTPTLFTMLQFLLLANKRSKIKKWNRLRGSKGIPTIVVRLKNARHKIIMFVIVKLCSSNL